MIEFSPPALVREVKDLAALAQDINAQHALGEDRERQGVEHYRRAGQLLAEAKRHVKHGQWSNWLKRNIKFGEREAQRYLALAKSVIMSDLQTAGTTALRDEWQRICGRSEPPHVAHNTGNQEWNTPAPYLDAARQVMGEIELDPASNEEAQKNVRAGTYYTCEGDGLAKHWAGKTWLNPPYTAGLVDRFADKLAEHFAAGDVPEAVVLVNNATDTKWFQRLAALASAACLPLGRVRFLSAAGDEGSPLQGQAVLYLGDNVDAFLKSFSPLGLTRRLVV